ncbi:MAG TPA: DUF4013 domain-containing protein [Thermoanaerobaculia bacterium]
MRLSWRSALTFMTRETGWRRKLLLGGLFFLPFPPLGWLLALGYRSLTGVRLVQGLSPVLPGWEGNLAETLGRGVRAAGIILAYFTPFLLLYWLLGTGFRLASVPPGAAAAFLAVIIVFPPVMPVLAVAYPLRFPWLRFSAPEIAVLAAVFLLTFFVLPAAFVQVGLEGRWAGAFHPRSYLRYVARNLRTYCEAWALSLAVSAFAVCLGPLSPWGLFWSYLVILYTFNESLTQWDTPEVHRRFESCVLLRTLGPGPP